MGEAREREVVVVGAGAAGLWAAAGCARAGRDVLLLEKTPRTGTKVLASGGTRCNLTTSLPPDAAARLFGSKGERFLRRAFQALTPRDVREHFHALGVPSEEHALEKVFPTSGRALDVRDALEGDARAAGAELRVEAPLRALRPDGDVWELRLASDELVRARAVVLCVGGQSYPRTGCTGDGYAWLRELGLRVVEPVPALVPLASPASWVRELTGIALQDVELRLLDAEGARLGRRRRPIVFTHHGLSGPGAMDLAEPVAREAARARAADERPRAHRLELDLAPDHSWEQLRAILIERAARPGNQLLVKSTPVELPRRVAEAVLRQADIDVEGRCAQLDKSARHRWIQALKALAVPVDGTLGFERAELTAGGLALPEVHPGTMAVRGHAGLYVCGELLDLQGPIGGLSFQAAFSTAELAARALRG